MEAKGRDANVYAVLIEAREVPYLILADRSSGGRGGETQGDSRRKRWVWVKPDRMTLSSKEHTKTKSKKRDREIVAHDCHKDVLWRVVKNHWKSKDRGKKRGRKEMACFPKEFERVNLGEPNRVFQRMLGGRLKKKENKRLCRGKNLHALPYQKLGKDAGEVGEERRHHPNPQHSRDFCERTTTK